MHPKYKNVKMKIYFIFFLFFCAYAYTQEPAFAGFVYSNSSGLPVENATVKVNVKKKYLISISNNKGKFQFKDFGKNEIQSVEVSHISFNSKKINKFVDTIFLDEKINHLSDVIISSKKQANKLSLSPLKKLFTEERNFSWDESIAVFVPQELENKEKKIKKLLYAVSDYGGVKGLKYQPFSANVFSVDTITKLPKEPIIKGKIIVKKENEKFWVEVDVSEYNIKIPKEGIFIVMELLDKDVYDGLIVQSNKGLISAVPAIKVYAFDEDFVRKSYMKGRYIIGEDEENIWIEKKCHYLMDVEF